MLSWLLRKIVGIPEAPELSDSRTPGLRTSEGKMTLLSTVIAAVLALLAIWFPDLPGGAPGGAPMDRRAPGDSLHGRLHREPSRN
jgi:hypothetical protein